AKIRIRGLIGQAGVSRQTRAQQLVFVNGRAIESPLLSAALREGYHTALMKGQFPVTFLFLDLDPAAVDVNVHPAKREVRFRDPNSVREAIVHAIQRTLQSGREEWQEQFRAPAAGPGIADPGRFPASTAVSSIHGPGSPMPAITGTKELGSSTRATTEPEPSPTLEFRPNEPSTSIAATNWNDQP